jgi:hypothetical protein
VSFFTYPIKSSTEKPLFSSDITTSSKKIIGIKVSCANKIVVIKKELRKNRILMIAKIKKADT